LNLNLKHKILEQDRIDKIVKRISFQIHEKNLNNSEIFLIGVLNNGFILSGLIEKELKKISKSKIQLFSIKINKKKPLSPIDLNCDLNELKNKSIVLIDDVLNSGKTLIHCVKYLLDVPLSNFNTVVLIDRNHKKYPIKIDFKGLSLSTSIKENVSVVFEKNNSYAFID
jgi:pyrimidine operon attenuation protein/uracil phosphoribosyltransferase|tara:strand:+ start:9809 stop:10315 length:507 start_codon:yes stop_codon:yes gene_type:complete